jgi:glycosyltransferase involved in cell wall biosynthesis
VKVLHVIPAVADRYGGPSHAVLAMCRALGARGITTLVATTDADGSSPRPVPRGRPVLHRGVRVVFFPRQWGEALKYSGPLAAWLDAHVSEFDVVHVHGVFSHACLAGGLACRRHGVPYVVRPLGSLDPWSLGRRRLGKRLLWHTGAARLLRRAAAIHYTTAEERRLAESGLALTHGVVIPLGIDEDVLEADVSSGTFRQRHPELGSAPYVLSLSRLHPKKGLETLVEAFADATADWPLSCWRLVVAGDGEPAYVARLHRLAKRRGGGRILMPGWLAGIDRVAAYRDAALFALPSWQENFALSVAEALALGVPVVVSDRVNLAPDVLDAGAGWAVPPDAVALGDALRRAMQDEGGRAERGRAGRALARRRFAWSTVAGELESLYEAAARGVTEPACP